MGIPISDLTAGNLLALGVMMALFERQTTGDGRWVHTRLLEVMVFMLDFQASRWLMAGEVPGQAGNDHPTRIPTGVFPAADGPITLAASSARQWVRFCEAIDRGLAREAGMATGHGRSQGPRRHQRGDRAVTREKPRLHWIEVLDDAGIPCGAINTVDQVFADPQVSHLDMAKPVEHPRLGKQHIVGSAINMIGIDDSPRTATADAGAHTEEVLAWLGYPQDAIAALRAKHVV